MDLTLRKCPAEIHAALVRRAKKRNTSLRAEAIETLRASLGAELKLDEQALRRRIEEIPSQAVLTLEEAQEAIGRGRE